MSIQVNVRKLLLHNLSFMENCMFLSHDSANCQNQYNSRLHGSSVSGTHEPHENLPLVLAAIDRTDKRHIIQ